MRAVSVPFSPGRPSRLKNEPGILPEAYMRSSTSTVRGRKSTSRRLPATAVQRTIVSPWRTTTAPEACFAILPVSNEISLPEISTETRVTASLLICAAFHVPPVGRRSVSFFSYSERTQLSTCRVCRARSSGGVATGGDRHALAQQLDARQLARRGGLIAKAHDPVRVGDDQRPLWQ